MKEKNMERKIVIKRKLIKWRKREVKRKMWKKGCWKGKERGEERHRRLSSTFPQFHFLLTER